MISPIPCIIDTDPGVDDVIALLLALSSPHLLVLGITLTHGNCTLSSTEKNLAKLFYALENHVETTQGSTAEQERWRGVTDRKWRKKWGGEDAETIKVWKGCEGPLQGEAVTAKYFHGQVSISFLSRETRTSAEIVLIRAMKGRPSELRNSTSRTYPSSSSQIALLHSLSGISLRGSNSTRQFSTSFDTSLHRTRPDDFSRSTF